MFVWDLRSVPRKFIQANRNFRHRYFSSFLARFIQNNNLVISASSTRVLKGRTDYVVFIISFSEFWCYVPRTVFLFPNYAYLGPVIGQQKLLMIVPEGCTYTKPIRCVARRLSKEAGTKPWAFRSLASHGTAQLPNTCHLLTDSRFCLGNFRSF